METFIDDIAGTWAADIEEEYVHLPETNGNQGVVMPGASMRSSDMTVWHMTYMGQEAYREGMPNHGMIEGLHYNVSIVPYRPTPKNFFIRAEIKAPTGVNHQRAHSKTGSRMHKQAPLRVRP